MRPQGRSSLTGRTAPVQIALSVFLSSMPPCHRSQVEVVWQVEDVKKEDKVGEEEEGPLDLEVSFGPDMTVDLKLICTALRNSQVNCVFFTKRSECGGLDFRHLFKVETWRIRVLKGCNLHSSS